MRQHAKLGPELVVAKIKDYGPVDFRGLLASAIKQIPQIIKSPASKAQMTRLVDSSTITKTLGTAGHDDKLASSVGGLFSQMQTALHAMPLAATEQASVPAAEPQAADLARPKAKRKQGGGLERRVAPPTLANR